MKRSNVPECKYGENCYRKNKDHLSSYTHPSKLRKSSESNEFGLHYVRIEGLPERHNRNAMNLREILSQNTETPIHIWFFNFMIDQEWLYTQLPSPTKDGKPELTLIFDRQHIYGEKLPSQYKCEFIGAKVNQPFGSHHSKMLVLQYEKCVRIVILTANFIEADWHDKTQMFWQSNLLPIKDELIDSKTKFGADLIDYLNTYEKLGNLVGILKNCDFSSINVFLVASIPKRIYGHFSQDWNRYGLQRMETLLHQIANETSDRIIAQFSSIGSLGPNEESWLLSQFEKAMIGGKQRKSKDSNLDLIFPTIRNVVDSISGFESGASLCYTNKSHVKQTYLNRFLRQWKSDRIGRTRVMPHCKSYACAVFDQNDSFEALRWFLMTSANLSKAAWGTYEKDRKQFYIRSYELGVLFLPPEFGSDTFRIGSKSISIPYDIPCVNYGPKDDPWVWEYLEMKSKTSNREDQ